jgi:hypothetical protein
VVVGRICVDGGLAPDDEGWGEGGLKTPFTRRRASLYDLRKLHLGSGFIVFACYELQTMKGRVLSVCVVHDGCPPRDLKL